MITERYEVGYRGPYITLVTECSNCGQILLGKIHTTADSDWSKISKLASGGISCCPICSKKVIQKEYSIWSAGDSAADLKKQLKEKIIQYETEEFRSELDKQIAKIKPVADMPANNEISEKIKADFQSLKAYIQQLIDLEIWTVFLKEHSTSIDLEKTSFTKASRYKAEYHAQSDKEKKNAKRAQLRAEIEKLKRQFNSTNWVNEVEMRIIPVPQQPVYAQEYIPVKPAPPIMLQPGLFNKKKIMAENERRNQEYSQACALYEQELQKLEAIRNNNSLLRKRYVEEMAKYHEDVEKEKKRVEAENEKARIDGAIKKEVAEKELNDKIDEVKLQIKKLNAPQKAEKGDSPVEIRLQKEKDECVDLLKSVYDAKNKFYAINVIYPNYRDIFAISSFFEYLNSERCYKLEDSDGAYNLYESERRSDAFSNFIRKLEDINKKQVVLYKEAEKTFNNLKTILNLLKDATKAVSKKESERGKITDKFIEEAFSKYSEKKNKFILEIQKTVDAALTRIT